MKVDSVQELVSKAAQRFAGSIAIDCGDCPITYRELEARSNDLANFLISSNASKGSLIAVLVEDTVHAISAIIGILKAGCVFVPLDATLPEKRLELMFAAAHPEWVVTEARLLAKLKSVVKASDSPIKVIFADKGRAERDQQDSKLICLEDYASHINVERLVVDSDPDQMCSIYFTSGSTGEPKAIAGRLKGIAHFVRWEARTLGVEEGTRVSQLTSPSFDGFLKDVFVPLCAGGTVCVPPTRELILDSPKLIDWMDAQRINVLHCVPSIFRSIVNARLDPARLSTLRSVVLAGERLFPSDVGRWMDVYGDRVKLLNLYGPTETTITKLYYFVKPSARNRRSIPIGKPMEGAAAMVVDEKGRPCPREAVGEIYIRTPYMALGYYNQPELSKQVFIQNPFNDDPNDIVYRTGDYGRVLEDGNFEFIGRRDQQVKIRGVRIELGEIENALRSHYAVKDVAVTDQEDPSGNNYLCAYLVPGEQVDAGALRAFLSKSLPEYMVPSLFIMMDDLPRTLNGKVDRRALPSPANSLSARKADYEAPRTLVEEVLSGICAQVLGRVRVSIHDDFFELGGHSLLATQVVSRIRDAFQVEVPLRCLFESPTIAGLALAVERAMNSGQGVASPPIEPVARTGAVPLSFQQQRMWLLSQLAPDSPAYNIHIALHIEGSLNVTTLRHAVSEISRRHESLRTNFSRAQGKPVQIVARPGPVFLIEADLRGLSGEAQRPLVEQLITRQARRTFDLARDPLLRVCLMLLNQKESILLLTLHHIIADGWSLGILARELGELYASFDGGQPSPLTELPIQYADFARWQEDWLRGDVLEAKLSYWKQQLIDAPAQVALTSKQKRRAASFSKGATRAFTLPPLLTESLRALSRREGCTLFMTLLSAFQATLHRYSGQDHITVGSAIAIRNRAEIEGLIGCFVNTIALNADLSGNPPFRQLLRRTRDVVLQAYAHQDVPYEMIVNALRKARNGQTPELFQTWFVLQNAPMPLQELPGLKIRARGADLGAAQFDLTMSLIETEHGLKGSLTYDSQLYEAETVQQMLEDYTTILEEVAADAEGRILDIALGQGKAASLAGAAGTLEAKRDFEDQFVF